MTVTVTRRDIFDGGKYDLVRLWLGTICRLLGRQLLRRGLLRCRLLRGGHFYHPLQRNLPAFLVRPRSGYTAEDRP